MNLTPHFTLDELTSSEIALRKGLDNTPPASVLENLRWVAEGLEQLRVVLGCPLHVTSGYRSPAVNNAIGGSPTSQHKLGEAADFVAPGYGTPLEVCRAILLTEIAFDQLIQEGGWVHVSFTRFGKPRRSVLTANFAGGRATYTKGV